MATGMYDLEGCEDKLFLCGHPLQPGGPVVFYVKLLSQDKNKKYPVKLLVSNISGTICRAFIGETLKLEDNAAAAMENTLEMSADNMTCVTMYCIWWIWYQELLNQVAGA